MRLPLWPKHPTLNVLVNPAFTQREALVRIVPLLPTTVLMEQALIVFVKCLEGAPRFLQIGIVNKFLTILPQIRSTCTA